MDETRDVRRTWYLLAVIPLAIGAAVAVRGVFALGDAVAAMPRVVVPGSGEVALDAGDHVAYGETASQLDGTVYRSASLQLRCGLQGAGGEPVALSTPTARSQYRFGGFAGESMFAMAIPRAGTYRFSCEGTGGPATVAFGTGLGGQILGLVLGALGGVFGALAVVFVVYRLRRRAARR